MGTAVVLSVVVLTAVGLVALVLGLMLALACALARTLERTAVPLRRRQPRLQHVAPGGRSPHPVARRHPAAAARGVHGAA
jgi:hypothetical protein